MSESVPVATLLQQLMSQMTDIQTQLVETQARTDERMTAMEESRDKVPEAWQEAIQQTVQRAVSAQAFHTASEIVDQRIRKVHLGNDEEDSEEDILSTPTHIRKPPVSLKEPLPEARPFANPQAVKSKVSKGTSELFRKDESDDEDPVTVKKRPLLRARTPNVPELYSGEDKTPHKLKAWARAVSAYLWAVGYGEDSPDAFLQIAGYTEGKAHEYLMDYGWPVVRQEMRNRASTTQWNLDHITKELSKRFVSPTAALDAEYEFEALTQYDPITKKWKDSATLAEEILDFGKRLTVMNMHQAKMRLINALHEKVALRVIEKGVRYADPSVDFETLKEAAVDAEAAYQAARNIEIAKKQGGPRLPNAIAGSASVRLRVKDKPEKQANSPSDREKAKKTQNDKKSAKKPTPDKDKEQSSQADAGQAPKKSTTRRRLSDEKKAELMAAGKCLNCEEVGHLAKSCPSKAAASNILVLEETKATVEPVKRSYADVLKGVKPAVIVQTVGNKLKDGSVRQEVLIGGHAAQALFDTGASHSIISVKLAEKLGLNIQDQVRARTMSLATEDSDVSLHGATIVNLIFMGKMTQTEFLVANIRESVIIGRDIMKSRSLLIGLNPNVVLEGKDLGIKPGQVVDLENRISINNYVVREAFNPRKDYLPDESERTEFRLTIHEVFKDVLVEEGGTPRLPPARRIVHTIPLVDSELKVRPRVYKVPDALRSQVKEFYDQHVKAGVWIPRQLDSASPLIPLTKKDGKLRPAIDLRQRNANTRKQISFLPDQDEIVEAMSRARFRGSADVKGAFQQILVAEKDLEQNGISTIFGTVVSKVALQGDLNSANTCQMVMNDIFKDHLSSWIRVYVDDIFIMADTWDDFKVRTKQMLEICRANKIDLSSKKLKLDPPELDVLGRVLTRSGMKMDPSKVTAIMNYTEPTSKKQVQKFMGLIQYNARFIPRLAEVAAPITTLTGKVPFRWSKECRKAFDTIKRLVSKDVTLVSINQDKLAKPGSKPKHLDSPPNPGTRVVNEEPGDYLFLASDASSTGAASVLLVGTNWWSAKPVGYHSRKFDNAQRNYPVHELELLAALEGVRHFENRLRGREFIAITDNRSLSEFLKTKEMTRGRTARWYTYFSQFAFTCEYIKGKHNLLADILSRQYEDDDDGDAGAIRQPFEFANADKLVEAEFEVNMMTLRDRAKVLTLKEGRGKPVSKDAAQSRAPPEGVPTQGRKAKVAAEMPGDLPNKQKRGTNRGNNRKAGKRQAKGKANTKYDRVLRDREAEAWAEAQRDAIFLDAEYMHAYWKAIEQGSQQKRPKADVIEIDRVVADQVYKLLYLQDHRDEDSPLRLYVPDALVRGRNVREVLLEHVHATLGHSADAKLLNHMQKRYYWPVMASDIRKYCKTCPSCQASKPSTQKPEGLLHALPIPERPWQVMGLDFMGPFQVSRIGKEEYDFLMVCIDHFSNEVELTPIHFEDGAEQVAQAYLNHVYCHHGIPETIVSDRDRRFVSEFWQTLHHSLGTTLAMSTSYHPESNGKTERMNRTINAMMRQLISEEQTDWAEQIPFIQFAINSTVRSSTGYAPFELTRGYVPTKLARVFNSPASCDRPAITFVRTAIERQENARTTIEKSEEGHFQEGKV